MEARPYKFVRNVNYAVAPSFLLIFNCYTREFNMKEYFNSTLLYTVYIFAAAGITMLIGGGVTLILIFTLSGAAEPGNFISGLINTIPVLVAITLPFAVVYIAMHRISYKRNTTYE